MNAREVKRHGADVFQLQILILLAQEGSTRDQRRRIHDLGNAEVLLREAGCADVSDGTVRHPGGRDEHERLAARGELAFVRADGETALSAARAGGTRAEGSHVWRDIDAVGGEHDGAGGEGEINRALELPAAEVHGETVRVDQFNVFLCLVGRGGVVVEAAKRDDHVRRLRGRDAVRTQGSGQVEKIAPARHVEVLQAVQFDFKVIRRVRHRGVGRAVGRRGPGGTAPLGLVHGGIRAHLSGPVVETAAEPVRVRGRTHRLEHRVHERADAAHPHGLQLGVRPHQRKLRVVVARADAQVRVDGVAEIGRAADPHVAEAQIKIPGQGIPFAGTGAVAVVIIIFMAAVVVAADGLGGEEINHVGQIHVVPEVAGARVHVAGDGDGVVEVLQVLRALGAARLLLVAGRAGKGVVHLVERAVRIVADALQVFLVALFHDVADHVENFVAMDTDRDGVVRRSAAGLFINLDVHVVARVHAVRPGGQDGEVAHLRRAGFQLHLVTGVEVEVFALAREAGGALAVQGDLDVVAELPVVKHRAARAGVRLRPTGVLREPVENWQRVRLRHQHHGAEILRHGQRVGVGRVARDVRADVLREDRVAHHLADGGGAGRDGCTVKAVARRHVAV